MLIPFSLNRIQFLIQSMAGIRCLVPKKPFLNSQNMFACGDILLEILSAVKHLKFSSRLTWFPVDKNSSKVRLCKTFYKHTYKEREKDSEKLQTITLVLPWQLIQINQDLYEPQIQLISHKCQTIKTPACFYIELMNI